MPGTSALAAMLGGLVILSLGARLATLGRTAPGTRPTAGGAAPTIAAALLGIALALAAPATGQPMYWAAAATAALCTAAGIGASREIDKGFGRSAYRLPSLSAADPATPGTISPAGAVAAFGAAFVLAALAFRVRLIGPSDAALIALAAFFATLLERWISARWKASAGRRFVPAGIASLAGAALAAGFVILLP